VKHYHFWKSFLETFGAFAMLAGGIWLIVAGGVWLWKLSPWIATGAAILMAGAGAMALSEKIR
jgi:hypothetical protein